MSKLNRFGASRSVTRRNSPRQPAEASVAPDTLANHARRVARTESSLTRQAIRHPQIRQLRQPLGAVNWTCDIPRRHVCDAADVSLALPLTSRPQGDSMPSSVTIVSIRSTGVASYAGLAISKAVVGSRITSTAAR